MYDTVIGALLVTSWVNCVLYMLEIRQMWLYFENQPKGGWITKAAVIFCFLMDTICTITNCIGVYKLCITFFGVAEYFNQYHLDWQIPVYTLTTGFVATIAQAFLIRKLYHLRKCRIQAAVFGLLIVTLLAGSIAVSVLIIKASSHLDLQRTMTPILIWSFGNIAVDLLISAFLLYALRSSRTAFGTMCSFIGYLLSLVAQTGVFTWVLRLVSMSVLLGHPEGNIATGISQCLGRVYTLTLLYNLANRIDSQEAARKGEPAVETLSLAGIQVHRTGVVQVDETPGIMDGRKESRRNTITKQQEDDDSLSGEDKSVPMV